MNEGTGRSFPCRTMGPTGQDVDGPGGEALGQPSQVITAPDCGTPDLYPLAESRSEVGKRKATAPLIIAAALIVSALGGGALLTLLRSDEKPTVMTGAAPTGANPAPQPVSDGCPPNDPPVLRTDVPRHCESHYDPARAEFDRFLESFGGMGALVPRLREEVFGERYGGWWGETADGTSYLIIALVNPTQTDQAKLADLTGASQRVRTAPVRYSMAQLEAWQETVSAIARRHNAQALPGIQANLNKLEIYIVETLPEALAAEIAGALPADAFSITISGRITPGAAGVTSGSGT